MSQVNILEKVSLRADVPKVLFDHYRFLKVSIERKKRYCSRHPLLKRKEREEMCDTSRSESFIGCLSFIKIK